MSERSDDFFMNMALEEARRGIGLTAPNPAVGAIVVKDGEVLGRGWHQKSGQPHAEREALADVVRNGHTAEGATIYVTLEPCSTQGRTGACTSAITEHQLARCVYAATDPNPAHAGAGRKVLERAGLKVSQGVCQAEAEHLIRAFAMVQTQSRPWVIAKTAMSLDGRITRPPGEPQWLTSPECRERVQALRAECDAILTGGATVRADDPALTIRGAHLKEGKKQPYRAVMTRAGLAGDFQILTDENSERTLVFENSEALGVLKSLKDRGVNTVLLEAGGELIGHFKDLGLIDEWVIFLAPLLTGGDKAAVAGTGASVPGEALELVEIDYERIGDDLMLRALSKR